MAIGSGAEIGVEFRSAGKMSMQDWEQWWAYMRDNWGEYLMSGYATLVHNKNNPYYSKPDEKDLEINRLNRVIDELRAEISRLSGLVTYL
jgi:hypothetical protein